MLYLSVLSGAFLSAVSSILRSKLLKDTHEDVVTVGTSVGVVLACLPFLWDEVQGSFWLPFFVSAGLNIFIQHGTNKALKLEEASVIVPLGATTPAWLTVFSLLILGEHPTKWGYGGIILIGVGAYVVSLQGSWLSPWLRLRNSKGARLSLYTAYLGAISLNFDKLATIASSPAFFTASVFSFVGLIVYFKSKRTGVWDKSPKNWKKLLLIGAIAGASNILMSAGFLYGIVPYVGALKRTRIFWAVLLAGLLLREKHMPMKILGSLIILAGTILVYF